MTRASIVTGVKRRRRARGIVAEKLSEEGSGIKELSSRISYIA
jgi:hypothetical protein